MKNTNLKEYKHCVQKNKPYLFDLLDLWLHTQHNLVCPAAKKVESSIRPNINKRFLSKLIDVWATKLETRLI